MIFTAQQTRKQLIDSLIKTLDSVPDEIIKVVISMVRAYLRSRKEWMKE